MTNIVTIRSFFGKYLYIQNENENENKLLKQYRVIPPDYNKEEEKKYFFYQGIIGDKIWTISVPYYDQFIQSNQREKKLKGNIFNPFTPVEG
jgi:hypothetical protein